MLGLDLYMKQATAAAQAAFAREAIEEPASTWDAYDRRIRAWH